ncbi:MAG: tetratricopeptide repeat protein [Planctomycetota bacterium]|nr:tetratricopeptide repeat protein [Planctomycetota bacterium]
MMVQFVKIKSRKGQLSVLSLVGLSLVIVLAGLWMYVSGPGRAGSRKLLKRLPAIQTTHLSSRARKILESCAESIQLAPEDSAAWGLLGRAFLAHQFQVAAGQCFQVASELDPQNPEWYYCHALTLQESESENRLQLMETAIGLGGAYRQTMQCKLAELLFEDGSYNACKSLLQTVLENSPRDLRANMLMARVLLNENDLDGSLKCASIVIMGQPDRKETLRLLSLIHSRLGNSAKASEFSKKSEAPLSFDVPWHDEIAQRIWDLRKDVNKLVNDALNLPPSRVNERIQVLRDAVEEEPQEPNWHGFLGQTLLQTRQFQEAEKVLAHGISLHPQSAVLYYTLGLVYLNQKKMNPAITTLKKAIAIKPDYDSAYLNLGIAYREQKDYKSAQAAFEKAIQILPGSFKAHLNLAVTLEVSGHRVGAVEAYRECLRLDEKSPEVCFLLGKLLAESEGGKTEAKLLLNQAIEINPEFSKAKQLLKNLQ